MHIFRFLSIFLNSSTILTLFSQFKGTMTGRSRDTLKTSQSIPAYHILYSDMLNSDGKTRPSGSDARLFFYGHISAVLIHAQQLIPFLQKKGTAFGTDFL